MTTTATRRGHVLSPRALFIAGDWAEPSAATTFDVVGVSCIPAANEPQAIEFTNDSIYGLNASVFTSDPERAYAVGRQLQSGIGREGGVEGLHPDLEAKAMVFETAPKAAQSGYDAG